MLVKQTKAQVRKYVRKYGSWSGYLVGCKVSVSHVVGGWHLGYKVELIMVGDWVVDKNRPNSTLDDVTYAWAYHNAHYETGYYPAFYRIEK